MFPCFTATHKSTTPKRRTLSDLLKIAHKDPAYQFLARTVGKKTADAALEMTYAIDSALAQGDEKRLAQDIHEMCRKETDNVIDGGSDIGRIFHDAIHRRFSRNHDPARLHRPSDYGALGSDPDTLKAAKWVCFQSASLTPDQAGDANVAAIGRVEAAIKRAIRKDLWSEKFPQELHKECAPVGTFDPLRGIMLGAKYPSTAGGRWLLKVAYTWMRGVRKPPPQTNGWLDVAGLLFGFLIRAHSFSDGNGRVARAAYATAILKGGLAFAAPTKATEDEMCRLR